jgi:hypothetical protein
MPSPLKSVFAPHLGRNVKFGRNVPKFMAPRLRASHFLDLAAVMPQVPATTNYRANAQRSLRNIYGNDELGDCVPAGLGHTLGLLTGNAGAEYVETLAQVKADYSAIGGYVDGDPSTDNGCDEDTALAYYHGHGFANGTKTAGSLAVDATNADEVRAMLYMFENLVFGVGLPDAWISPFPDKDGIVWDVAGPSNNQNGHCYVAVDLATNGLVIDTWALELVITMRATATYAVPTTGGQLFAVLSPDQISKAAAKAPNGMDWAALVTAFNQMGGHVAPVVVPPAPPSPPIPVPGAGPQLADAVRWTSDAFAAGPRALYRDAASKIAKAALTKHWPK